MTGEQKLIVSLGFMYTEMNPLYSVFIVRGVNVRAILLSGAAAVRRALSVVLKPSPPGQRAHSCV